jgi:hypothetical protein
MGLRRSSHDHYTRTAETTTETDENTGGVVGGTERLAKDSRTIKRNF